MKLILSLISTLFLFSGSVYAACSFSNSVPLKSLTAGFEAWKSVTTAMAECGNFTPELDQDFRKKQPDAFAAKPALYQIGGVANSTMVPLLDAGTIRPLDGLVAKYGGHLKSNQMIKIEGKIMAIAMMVNAQHLMYREDILNNLGIAVPTTYGELISAAEKIQQAGVVDYPLGGTYKAGWNLAEEYVNMYLGFGGEFFGDGNTPAINNLDGILTLETMKVLSQYMDPEYLVSDSTYVQKQFQQGKIAMANLWASRAGAMDDAKESQVVGKVQFASAPAPTSGNRPASTLWWDGIVIAKNISDAEAEAAFRVAMEGLDRQMVQAHNEDAIWLIDGYSAGKAAKGASDTATNGAVPYPASKKMGLMHTALGNGIADFLTEKKDARTALADIETAYTTAAKEAGVMN
ncbi:MAG TPA: extracellular solute-binding protein [Nitrospinaceae bacterium]|nr:extracellular solute-binding protein [Nitrospinaceae bacterium]